MNTQKAIHEQVVVVVALVVEYEGGVAVVWSVEGCKRLRARQCPKRQGAMEAVRVCGRHAKIQTL